MVIGAGVIGWNLAQEDRRKRVGQNAAARDLAQWQRIAQGGTFNPGHTHTAGDFPGIRSLSAHIGVEHGQVATVNRIIDFTTREQRPDVVTYNWLATEHHDMHEQQRESAAGD